MPGTFVCFAPKNFWKNAGCGKITSTEDRGTVLPFVYTRISCYVDLANAQYRTLMTCSNFLGCSSTLAARNRADGAMALR